MENNFPSIVCEWAENGMVMKYLKEYPETDICQVVRSLPL